VSIFIIIVLSKNHFKKKLLNFHGLHHEFGGLKSEAWVDPICLRLNIKNKDVILKKNLSQTKLFINHMGYLWIPHIGATLTRVDFKPRLGKGLGQEVSRLTCWVGPFCFPFPFSF
jgi:hypothetical protein